MKLFTDAKGNRRKFVSPKQVAESLGVNVLTVRRWVAAKKLEAYALGKGIRIPEEEVERFLQSRSIGSTRSE